jgi:hypothetical protein
LPFVRGLKNDVPLDVLRAVRLSGATYFDFELSSPWVLEAPPFHAIAATVMPGLQHVTEYLEVPDRRPRVNVSGRDARTPARCLSGWRRSRLRSVDPRPIRDPSTQRHLP